MDEERRAAPRLCMLAIERDCEDDLGRRVVVGQEVVAVRRGQGVHTGVNHRFGGGPCLVVRRRAGVDSRVEVHVGQQHLRGPRRGPAVRRRTGRGQVGQNGGQLAHDEPIDAVARDWGRRRAAEGIGLGRERAVPEHVDEVPVAERAQEPRLGPVVMDGGDQRRVVLVP